MMQSTLDKPGPRMDTSRVTGAVTQGYWHANCYYGSYRSKLGQVLCVKVDMTNGSAYVISSRQYEQYAKYRNQSEWDRIGMATQLRSEDNSVAPAKKKRLGDRVESAIKIATFGKGKRIARRVARMLGKKDCGCNARKEALNTFGEKIGL